MIDAVNVTETVNVVERSWPVNKQSKIPTKNVITEVSPNEPNLSLIHLRSKWMSLTPGITSKILQTNQLIPQTK